MQAAAMEEAEMVAGVEEERVAAVTVAESVAAVVGRVGGGRAG
jgi:hypothetical protein